MEIFRNGLPEYPNAGNEDENCGCRVSAVSDGGSKDHASRGASRIALDSQISPGIIRVAGDYPAPRPIARGIFEHSGLIPANAGISPENCPILVISRKKQGQTRDT